MRGDLQAGQRLARAACLAGGVLDGLMLVPMLAPGIGGRLFRIPSFAPGADYRYAMNVGASLMLGWTLLLFWAAARPRERAAVLLLTSVVVSALMAAGAEAARVGFMPWSSTIPVLAVQSVLVGLFLVAYLQMLRG